ncbi:hypothetical protein F2Q70_00009934 [Brassica cretica]|uniref:Uncharacterized protein n=1 Tax=Brassica cretica TaxID=69181 RepID=A0A8S9LXZ3_BRACR|nr:hypothetical protein F2Q70_00009934 [Brassica cretica]
MRERSTWSERSQRFEAGGFPFERIGTDLFLFCIPGPEDPTIGYWLGIGALPLSLLESVLVQATVECFTDLQIKQRGGAAGHLEMVCPTLEQ